MKKTLVDELQTEKLGALIAEFHKPGLAITLQGQIGAGKTTFARGFLKSLGYTGHVKSPTFTLIEYYEFETYDLLHIDLFRIEHKTELDYLGVDTDDKNPTTFLIEWPKFDLNFVCEIDININFEVLKNRRQAILAGYTEEGRQLLEALKV